MNPTRLASIAYVWRWLTPRKWRSIAGIAIVRSAEIWKLSGIQYALSSDCAAGLRMTVACQPNVDDGDEEQRQEQRAEQAADDDDAERFARRDRRIEPERER